MWDSACEAIDGEVKRIQPAIDTYSKFLLATELVQPAHIMCNGVAVPTWINHLLEIARGYTTEQTAEWLRERVNTPPVSAGRGK